jgi:hypothetical protein
MVDSGEINYWTEKHIDVECSRDENSHRPTTFSFFFRCLLFIIFEKFSQREKKRRKREKSVLKQILHAERRR